MGHEESEVGAGKQNRRRGRGGIGSKNLISSRQPLPLALRRLALPLLSVQV